MSVYILDKLKNYRVERGWSQNFLSEISGVSLRTIQRVESGTPASIETAKSLTATFSLRAISELTSDLPAIDVGERGYSHSTGSEQCNRSPKRLKPMCFKRPTDTLFHVCTAAVIILSFWMSHAGFNEFYNTLFIVVAASLLAVLVWFQKPAKSGSKESYEVDEGWSPSLKPLRCKGFEYYLQRYPIPEYKVAIGVNSENNKLVCRGKGLGIGSLLIGEYGSGVFMAALGQLHPLLNEQKGGVILGPSDAYSLPHVKSLLKYVGRSDDLLIASAADLVLKDIKWWSDSMHQSKVIFVVTEDAQQKHIAELQAVFFEHLHPLRETGYQKESERPFLMICDKYIDDTDVFLDNLYQARMSGSGLSTLLLVLKVGAFLQKNPQSLLNFFDHKHFMKIRDPKDISMLLDLLSVNEYTQLNVADIVSHRAGESSYLFNDILWKKLQMIYLDLPMNDTL